MLSCLFHDWQNQLAQKMVKIQYTEFQYEFSREARAEPRCIVALKLLAKKRQRPAITIKAIKHVV